LISKLVAPVDSGQDMPVFLTRPQEIKARQGENLNMQCQTAATGSAVITWNWNGRLLSAGSMRIYDDDRINVINDGRELIIRGVTPEDRGEYSCTINLKLQPVSLSHQVEVLVKPTVLIRSKDKIVKVEEGSKVEISCSVSGFPKPHVHWRKNSNHEIKNIKHPKLIISQVEPENAGEYACVASNSEGRSEDVLQINVLFKPRTEISRQTSTKTYESSKIILTCQVNANPPAKVFWYKDGLIISNEMRKSTKEEELFHHSLILPSMMESDYGNYSCLAKNNLGTSSDYISISGSPDKPRIISSTESFSTNTYKLEWEVWTSRAFPILNQSILYRMLRKGYSNIDVSEEPGSWFNLALVSDATSDSQGSYSMALTGLEKGAEYEVRLRAMNRQGWSSLSDSFKFKMAESSYQIDSLSSLSGSHLTSNSSKQILSYLLLPIVFLSVILAKQN